MEISPILLEKAAGPLPLGALLVIYALIFGAMWFFLIRPQKKKQKEEKKMRENLSIGDEIVTIGGIYGRVVGLDNEEETVNVEVAKGTVITISRYAIQTLIKNS